MNITFHGAAQTVTGSKHLIQLESGTQILLDCGMFQGMGAETREMNEDFGFDASKIDYLLLSHAHIDHCGLVPLLVKRGFQGTIIATSATIDLAAILMEDSAHIQVSDNKYENKKLAKRGLPPVEPLYNKEDAEKVLTLFQKVDFDVITKITDEFSVQFLDAGHIIGAASIHLTLHENGKTTQLAFSGDVGRYEDLILKAPSDFPQADFVLIESTYGNRLHKDAVPAENIILEVIKDTCINRKGKVIIPAFSVGRTQELLYLLNDLYNRGILPKVPYYVDSPLSQKATQVLKSHPECFNKEVESVLLTDNDPFGFDGLHFVKDAEESKALNLDKSPMVVISASGMAEAGRVKHHIAHAIMNTNNTILLVGYCEPRSLGGRLKAGATEVSIFGDKLPVNAQIHSVQSMSAHADYEDLIQFLSCQDKSKLKKIFLVHGEIDVQTDFKNTLIKEGYSTIEIPKRHESFKL